MNGGCKMELTYRLSRVGERLEFEEDFTRFKEWVKDGVNLPKYQVIYDPLFRINPQGVRTFSGLYQVIKLNGGEEILGVVSSEYRPISTTRELEELIKFLQQKEEDFKIGKIEVIGGNIGVNITFSQNEIEIKEIIPYETLAGHSYLHRFYKLPYEKLQRGISLLNGYVGQTSNAITGFWFRLICFNGLRSKGFGVSFKHRFLTKNLEEILRKVFIGRNKVERVFRQNPQALMKDIRKDYIDNLFNSLSRYGIRMEIKEAVAKEIELITEVRDGRIPKWDFVNVLTSLSSHTLNEKSKFALRKALNNKAFQILISPN